MAKVDRTSSRGGMSMSTASPKRAGKPGPSFAKTAKPHPKNKPTLSRGGIRL